MKFIDRAIFYRPCEIALTADEEGFTSDMRKLGIDSPLPFAGDSDYATMQWYERENASPLAIVCVNWEACNELSTAKLAGLIAHEATHIFQELCIYMVEDNPSQEFEAYGIEQITSELFALLPEKTNTQRKKWFGIFKLLN